ncbi:hypothetical protein [Caulobacter phage Cr30]|uniref:hypothetical protein n=1 Tax=Caulobacter phage Cr30 TaxID=1357714 RepID=UPI0004A9B55A|nr:hypothetical protein OZ74_gp276 [Caulobacter phage Cr30]AGS81067.1 hypothetical protein [Caulobacter phage Cr30]
MKLITELYDCPVEYLSEGTGDEKKHYIEGIYLVAGVPNKNGRIYPPHLMEREVEKYTTSHINENRAWGELDHPPSPQISLKNVSHRTLSLNREGNNWIGKSIITEDTAMGKIALGLIKSGGKLGTSSRGLGTLRKNRQGINEVQDDFNLRVAGDLVSDPSGPGAFVNAMMENAEWILDPITGNWEMRELVENIQKDVRNTSKSELSEKFTQAFQAYCDKLITTSSKY